MTVEIRDAYDLIGLPVTRINHPSAQYALEDGTPLTLAYLAHLGLARIRVTFRPQSAWVADLIWPETKTFPGPNPALAERLIGQQVVRREDRHGYVTTLVLADGTVFDNLRRREQGIERVVVDGGRITIVGARPWQYDLVGGSVYRQNRETGEQVCLWIDPVDLAKNAGRYADRAQDRILAEFRELVRAIEGRKLREMMRLWIQQGRNVWEDDKGMMDQDVEVALPDGARAVVDLYEIACATCDHRETACTFWGSQIDPPEYEDVCRHPALPSGEAGEVLGHCRGRYWSDAPAVRAAYTQNAWFVAQEEASVYERPCRLTALDDQMEEQHGENWRDDPALLAAYQADVAAINAEYVMDPDTGGPHPGAHRLLKMKEESP